MKKQIICIMSATFSLGLFGQCNPKPEKVTLPRGYELVKRVDIAMTDKLDTVETFDFAMANNELYKLMFVEDDQFKSMASYELYEESFLLGSNHPKNSDKFYPEFDFKCKRDKVYQLRVNRITNDKYCGSCLLLRKLKDEDQVAMKETETQTEEPVFVIVEKMPAFVEGKGEKAFREWVNQNLEYPKEAQDKKIQGRVYVQFYVDVDGFVKGIKVVRGVDPILDKEAVRVVSSSPQWVSCGYQRGRAVRVQYTIPLDFVLK